MFFFAFAKPRDIILQRHVWKALGECTTANTEMIYYDDKSIYSLNRIALFRITVFAGYVITVYSLLELLQQSTRIKHIELYVSPRDRRVLYI